MNMLGTNRKTALSRLAFALLICAALLQGCRYDANYVQINGGARATSVKDTHLTIHAENGKGVYAYYLTETSATQVPPAPAANDTSWQSIPNASTVCDIADLPHPLAAEGMRTIHVWFKDGYGTVSDPVSDTITYATAGGPTAPAYP